MTLDWHEVEPDAAAVPPVRDRAACGRYVLEVWTPGLKVQPRRRWHWRVRTRHQVPVAAGEAATRAMARECAAAVVAALVETRRTRDAGEAMEV